MKSFCLIILFFFLVSPVAAKQTNQFITIVNPVRISKSNPDPVSSLKAQYKVISQLSLPATWLVTYDILANPETVAVLKKMPAAQEIGIFMEVTPSFARSAGVGYHDSGDWHYAKSVLLSGYLPSDRAKLIDTVFTRFKAELGYYPTSVGSWWTDGYSLAYIKDKYHITANLGVADQFQTDGYQVWGQYWSTPYYPSISHPAVPASSLDNKLDVVTLQWAARDPLNGYRSSLYSTQDYFTKPAQDISYFSKLVELYASRNSNQFGQITVGLEGDFPPQTYSQNFLLQMQLVQKLTTSTNFSATNMRQFSDWYRQTFNQLSPAQTIIANDLLGKNVKTVWYQSVHYRIGLTYDPTTQATNIFDFRKYSDDLKDPYYQLANGERDLFINVPSVIDAVAKPGSEKTVSLGDFVSVDEGQSSLVLNFTTGQTTLVASPPPADLIIHDLSPRIPYALRSRLGQVINTQAVLICILLLAIVFRVVKPLRWGIILLLVIYLIISWQFKYFVSQSEVDALNYLNTLPKGIVLVYDKDCLRCFWSTPVQPAALANKRNYVAQLSHHPVVYSNGLLTARDGGDGKQVLKRKRIRYLYLVKYGDYIETPHFSPTDLNVSKVYENANAVIWHFSEDFY